MDPGPAWALGGIELVEGGRIETPNTPVASTQGDWNGDGQVDIAVVGDEVWVYVLDASGAVAELTEGLCEDGLLSISNMNDDCIYVSGSAEPCFLNNDGSGAFSETSISGGGVAGLTGHEYVLINRFSEGKKTVYSLDSYSSYYESGSLTGYNRSLSYSGGDQDEDGCGGYIDYNNSPTTIELGSELRAIALGDAAGDSDVEVFVADVAESTVWVYEAASVYTDELDGDWYKVEFDLLDDVSVPDSPVAIAVGDFDGDGAGDFAVACQGDGCFQGVGGVVEVRFGDGEGGFSDRTRMSLGGVPQTIGAGDFDGDKIDDIAVASGEGVSLLMGSRERGFRHGIPEVVALAAEEPTSMLIADFDADGRQDIALTDYANDEVFLFLNSDDLDEDGGVALCGDPEFLRGDSNGNGSVEALQDSLHLLSYAFLGRAKPPCLEAADCDGNNGFSGIIDGVFLLSWGFTGGPAPPAPGSSCGPDDDDSVVLGCKDPPRDCLP